MDLILSFWYGLLEIIHETYLKGETSVQRRAGTDDYLSIIDYNTNPFKLVLSGR